MRRSKPVAVVRWHVERDDRVSLTLDAGGRILRHNARFGDITRVGDSGSLRRIAVARLNEGPLPAVLEIIAVGAAYFRSSSATVVGASVAVLSPFELDTPDTPVIMAAVGSRTAEWLAAAVRAVR